MIAGQNAGQLGHRRKRTSSQDGGCNQRTHGDFILSNEVYAINDHSDCRHLLQEGGEIHGAGREQTGTLTVFSHKADGLFPFTLDRCFRPNTLDGFQTCQRLNQGRTALP